MATRGQGGISGSCWHRESFQGVAAAVLLLMLYIDLEQQISAMRICSQPGPVQLPRFEVSEHFRLIIAAKKNLTMPFSTSLSAHFTSTYR